MNTDLSDISRDIVIVHRQTVHYAAQLCPNKVGVPLGFAHRRRRFNWQNPLLERVNSNAISFRGKCRGGMEMICKAQETIVF